MINFLILGVWSCLVALGAVFGVVTWQKAPSEKASDTETAAPATELMRTKTISVPMLVEGKVDGYVVARFDVLVDTEKRAASAATAESLVADEAFKQIYNRHAAEFRAAQKHDLKALTKTIAEGVNARQGNGFVTDVLIESWSYLTKEDVDKLNAE